MTPTPRVPVYRRAVDSGATLHRVVIDDPVGVPRLMQRVPIQGERPV